MRARAPSQVNGKQSWRAAMISQRAQLGPSFMCLRGLARIKGRRLLFGPAPACWRGECEARRAAWRSLAWPARPARTRENNCTVIDANVGPAPEPTPMGKPPLPPPQQQQCLAKENSISNWTGQLAGTVAQRPGAGPLCQRAECRRRAARCLSYFCPGRQIGELVGGTRRPSPRPRRQSAGNWLASRSAN